MMLSTRDPTTLPYWDFTDTGYDFFTPDDTGTGIAAKRDLLYMTFAMLSLTKTT